MDEQALRAFGAMIVQLQSGEQLSRDQSRAAYTQIFRNEQPDLQQGALVAAHACVPPSVDALVGLTEAHNIEWDRCVPPMPALERPHLGIVGVGLDGLKSFNVSSAAAVVAAACGVWVHKVGAPGMTGVSGSADAFALWGVQLDTPVEAAYRALPEINLGFTTPVSPRLRHMGIGRVLSQMRCKTMIHLAGPLGFHSGERHKIIGVPAPPVGQLIVAAMQQLGYQRGFAPCGTCPSEPGKFMDEVSNLGPTIVSELIDGEITQYTLTPEMFGIEPSAYADIAAAPTREGNARIGAQTIAGRQPGAYEDLLAINAAACLHVMGACSDWADGTAKAREAIRSGAALATLEQLLTYQSNDPKASRAQLHALL